MGLVTIASKWREKTPLADYFRSTRQFESPDRIRFVTSKTFKNEGANFAYVPYEGPKFTPVIKENNSLSTKLSLTGLPENLIRQMMESASLSSVTLLDIYGVVYAVPSNAHTTELPLFGVFNMAGIQAYMVSLLSQVQEFYNEHDTRGNMPTFSTMLLHNNSRVVDSQQAPPVYHEKCSEKYEAPKTNAFTENPYKDAPTPVTEEKLVTINNIYNIFKKEETNNVNTPRFNQYKSRIRSSNL